MLCAGLFSAVFGSIGRSGQIKFSISRRCFANDAWQKTAEVLDNRSFLTVIQK